MLEERAAAGSGATSPFSAPAAPPPRPPIVPLRKKTGDAAAAAKRDAKKKDPPEPPPPPPEPVAAASGEVKIDISKAHSVFYVPCIKRSARQLAFCDVLPPSARNDTNASIYWHDRLDVPLTKYHVGRLKQGQKMNRFLTMQYQARKNPLAKKLNRLQQLYPKDYDFHPTSWRFPADVAAFKRSARKWQPAKDGSPAVGKPVFYILKPDNGSKGQGICLAEYSKVLQTWAQMSLIRDDEEEGAGDDECSEPRGKGRGAAGGKSGGKGGRRKGRAPRGKAPIPNFQAGEGRQVCVQEYLEPFLLGGHKFDLRLYVVLESVNPLKCYICRQGMVRRAMVPYEPPSPTNLKTLHMHLTNTSLNAKFEQDSSGDSDDEDEEEGEEEDDDDEEDDEPAACKQYMGIVMDQLGGMGIDTAKLWQSILRVVSLTMGAIQPELAIAYTSAFMKPEVQARMLARRGGGGGRRVGRGGGARDPPACLSQTLDYSRCFQIIGFDILLDKACKPYIIEINHNPSFKLPTPLDVDIKTTALTGCLGIVCDRLMERPTRPSVIPEVPTSSGTEHVLDQAGQWSRPKNAKCTLKTVPISLAEGGLLSSKTVAQQIAYTPVPKLEEPLTVFDRAFKLFEAVCTQALVLAFESQNKALEDQGKPAMVFGSSGGAPQARRGLEMLSPAELRDKDAWVLQDIIARCRLPQGVAFDPKGDFKEVFKLTRTPVAHVLVLDGFCDGLVEIANMIAKVVATGRGCEERPTPNGKPVSPEVEACLTARWWTDTTTTAEALHLLITRMHGLLML